MAAFTVVPIFNSLFACSQHDTLERALKRFVLLIGRCFIEGESSPWMARHFIAFGVGLWDYATLVGLDRKEH